MAVKYHVNLETGAMGKCSAQIKCPLIKEDGINNHFSTQKEAIVVSEQILEKQFNSMNGLKKGDKTNDKVSKLGVQKRNVEYEGDDAFVFHYENYSGKIDPSQLGNDSYKEFGFNLLSKDGTKIVSDLKEAENIDQIVESSIKETDSFSADEHKLLNWYSGEDYVWVNKECFNPNPQKFDEKYKNTDDLDPWFKPKKPFNKDKFLDKKFDRDERERSLNVNPYSMNSKQFGELINKLDDTLDKGAKKQRMVYHGKVVDYEDVEKGGYKNSGEFVKDTYRVGSEITFDGYMSTSLNPNTAANFGGPSDTVIYEILTPEGVNITSCSQNDLECEVLLPRKQRYMVVGVHSDKDLKIGWEIDRLNRKSHLVQLVAINEDQEILDGTNSVKPQPLYSK